MQRHSAADCEQQQKCRRADEIRQAQAARGGASVERASPLFVIRSQGEADVDRARLQGIAHQRTRFDVTWQVVGDRTPGRATVDAGVDAAMRTYQQARGVRACENAANLGVSIWQRSE